MLGRGGVGPLLLLLAAAVAAAIVVAHPVRSGAHSWTSGAVAFVGPLRHGEGVASRLSRERSRLQSQAEEGGTATATASNDDDDGGDDRQSWIGKGRMLVDGLRQVNQMAADREMEDYNYQLRCRLGLIQPEDPNMREFKEETDKDVMRNIFREKYRARRPKRVADEESADDDDQDEEESDGDEEATTVSASLAAAAATERGGREEGEFGMTELQTTERVEPATDEVVVAKTLQMEKKQEDIVMEEQRKQQEDDDIVKNPVTGRPVELYDDPELRLAQMFPSVPLETRQQFRITPEEWKTLDMPALIDKLRQACEVQVQTADGQTIRGIPDHPQISQNGIDFVISNRDLLGAKMDKTLGRLKLRAHSQRNRDETLQIRQLWKNYKTLEKFISGPFEQVVKNAVPIVGSNFGNFTALRDAVGTTVVDRAAAYIVLKSTVVFWERKVLDALQLQDRIPNVLNKVELLLIGDPRRKLPAETGFHRLEDVARIASAARNMTRDFVETPELFNAELPLELLFVEAVYGFRNSGKSVREYLLKQFCPTFQTTPEAMREALQRLDVSLTHLSMESYGDLKKVVGRIVSHLGVATSTYSQAIYDPYIYSVDPEAPGRFPTYTTNLKFECIPRLLDEIAVDNAGKGAEAEAEEEWRKSVQESLGKTPARKTYRPGRRQSEYFRSRTRSEIMALDEEPYDPPKHRALGRAHESGWLEFLQEEEEALAQIYRPLVSASMEEEEEESKEEEEETTNQLPPDTGDEFAVPDATTERVVSVRATSNTEEEFEADKWREVE